MQITDIKIRRTFEEGPLRAVVSITLDDALAIHDVKVVYAREHYFVVMPSHKNADGSYRDIVHPIHSSLRAAMEEAIIGAYHAYLAEAKSEVQEEKAVELAVF